MLLDAGMLSVCRLPVQNVLAYLRRAALASRKRCDLKTWKRCDFYHAAQKVASDFSATSSAIFWRFFCDFCGKTCDLVLCDLKTQRFFCKAWGAQQHPKSKQTVFSKRCFSEWCVQRVVMIRTGRRHQNASKHWCFQAFFVRESSL